MIIDKKDHEMLERLFGDRPIKVRGQVGITNHTVLEFTLYLKGYLAFGAKDLLLYRFHHGAGESESLSYALLIAAEGLGLPIFDYSYWVVFPDFVRTGGGTGRAGYDTVEELIKKALSKVGKARSKVVDKEISSEDFLEFLKAKEKSWH